MDISLNSQAEAFARQKLNAGAYRSLSDLVNEALRLMLEREQRLATLKAEIQTGIEQAERGEWIDAETVFSALEKRMQA
jgi:antitoxin ParD1/3/4